MLDVVSQVCLVLSGLCFLLYALQVIVRLWRAPSTAELRRAAPTDPAAATAIDLAKLIEAFAKLADSLEKAGPLTGALIGSMFFAVLAALAAGFGS